MRSRNQSSKPANSHLLLNQTKQSINTTIQEDAFLPRHRKTRRKLSPKQSFMFPKIDAFLATHSPPWYRTPVVQTAALGVVFFFVFAAYTTIQFYAASIYGSNLASDSVSAVYFTFTLTCLVAPGIINKWGCRMAMFIGVLGYASLVLASLIYFLCGGEEVMWARRLVVLGGAVLGCGASILWTAQGRLILQYAAKATELEILDRKSSDESVFTMENVKNSTQTGKLMGLFWAIFQCSSLVGGSISFMYYNKKPEGSTALYCLFLGFILMGAVFTQFLLPPSVLRKHTTTIFLMETVEKHIDVEMISEQTPLKQSNNTQHEGVKELKEVKEVILNEELSHQSWWQEAKCSLNIFFTKEMLCLFLLFFYTGFNQPYQQATFGNRFFTRRTIGAELIIFHLMEILGAIVCGRFLDKDKNANEDLCDKSNRRKRAVMCLGGFILINSTGNLLAAMEEYESKHSSGPTAYDVSDVGVIPPSLAFACWGFADAQIQVYCYWLMGGLYNSGSDHSRAVGFYKCVQSLGTSVGYYLIPTSRLGELSQLSVSSCFFIIGTGLSFAQLP
ncbi:hypothetical protein ACHAXS_013383 [Conticribra weissflogii]